MSAVGKLKGRIKKTLELTLWDDGSTSFSGKMVSSSLG
jgi:hypothetical protein